MSVNGSLKIKFGNTSICDFWIAGIKELKEVTLPFHTSCLSHQRTCVSKASLPCHKSKRNTGTAWTLSQLWSSHSRRFFPELSCWRARNKVNCLINSLTSSVTDFGYSFLLFRLRVQVITVGLPSSFGTTVIVTTYAWSVLRVLLSTVIFREFGSKVCQRWYRMISWVWFVSALNKLSISEVWLPCME